MHCFLFFPLTVLSPLCPVVMEQDSAAAQQYSRQGCPTGLRADLWALILNSTNQPQVLYAHTSTNTQLLYILCDDVSVMKQPAAAHTAAVIPKLYVYYEAAVIFTVSGRVCFCFSGEFWLHCSFVWLYSKKQHMGHQLTHGLYVICVLAPGLFISAHCDLSHVYICKDNQMLAIQLS